MAITKVPSLVSSASPEFPEYNVVLQLATAAAESWTVPSNVGWVIISPDAAIWVSTTATAVVPAADSTNGTAPFRIPANAAFQCGISAGKVLSIIREGGATVLVSIGCWRNQGSAYSGGLLDDP